jgi:hypothetical protein
MLVADENRGMVFTLPPVVVTSEDVNGEEFPVALFASAPLASAVGGRRQQKCRGWSSADGFRISSFRALEQAEQSPTGNYDILL